MLSASRSLRPPMMAALIVGAWVAVLLVLDRTGDAWQAWLLVPLSMASTLLISLRQVAGVVVMLAAGGVAVWAGLGYGEIELLLPMLYVAAYLGRHSAWIGTGLITVIALAAVTALRAGAPWYAVIVSTGVYATAWAFGLIVRHRAIAATAAARESAVLAAVDLEKIVAASSLTARERATSQALAVLRDAVGRMCTLTVRASVTGPPYARDEVDAIRGEGERAIEQLHGTLILLDAQREEAVHGMRIRSTSPDSAASGILGSDLDEPPPRAKLLRALFFGHLVITSVGGPLVLGRYEPTLLVAAAALPLCAWAARRLPVAAGSVAALAQLGAAVGPDFAADAMLPMGMAYGALVWQLSTVRQVTVRIVLIAMIAAALALGMQFGVPGFGFIVVLTTLSLIAAVAWREHDTILHEEQVRAAKLMSAIAAATSRGARTARQRLARELHDGVSHGITAMTLQAAAAHALGDRDPEQAERCMLLARQVGAQTLREIDALARERLDENGPHSAGLDALVEGARAAGLQVEAPAALQAGRPDRLTYRIVQEALTNASRYAPGARIDIEAGIRGASRFVRVADTGTTQRPKHSGARLALQQLGLGSGLAGLAARISECDGEFRAGPKGAGFEVFAQWPLRDAETMTTTARRIDG